MKSKSILIVEDEFVVANDIALILKKAGYTILGIADSVPEALAILEKKKPEIVLLDIRLKGKLTGIDLAYTLKENYIPFIYLSANSNASVLEEAKKTNPYGFLVKPFREKDILISLEIAAHHYKHTVAYQTVQKKELENKLKALTATEKPLEFFLQDFVKAFQSTFAFDFCLIQIEGFQESSNGNMFGFNRIAYNEYQIVDIAGLSNITGIVKTELVTLLTRNKNRTEAILLTTNDSKDTMTSILERSLHMKSAIYLPLEIASNHHISFSFFSKQEENYTAEHLELWNNSRSFILEKLFKKIRVNPVSNDSEKIIQSTKKRQTLSTNTGSFSTIIGKSTSLLRTFDQIKRVAPMDTTVLVLGESGTGKELIAKSIHNLSQRKDQKLVTINCATLPENLAESILFGHEKGSFTGATEKKIGKFEQAHGGTLFLDEIGEISLDIQAKLLRVLQEKELETLGGLSPIAIDVRIIAATNRNLEKEVAEGNFRLDLYYRLNIFPITMPPLRERNGDIDLLIDYYLHKFASEANSIKITDEVRSRLNNYEWPGNVRELEHYIERSALLANDQVIDQIHYPLNKTLKNSNGNNVQSIAAIERKHILKILKRCGGKVFGKGGAAELLNIPPSTLNSKIKKLGIDKRDIYSSDEM